MIPNLGTVLPLLGKYWKPVGIAFAVGAVLGFWLGWRVHRPVSIRETAAPQVTLPSGGIVAERTPGKPLPPIAKEAARELKGKPTRGGHVTVQPRTSDAAPSEMPVAGSAGPASLCSCAPVRVDWSLIGLPDGSSRMAFASDATILQAIDIPVDSASYGKPKPWAVGVSYSTERTWGGWVTRDAGPFTFGVEVENGRDGLAAEAMVGIRF
jgi:hypothetical protein